MAYAKIDRASREVISSALNFFDPPCTNVAYQKSYYRDFQPDSPLENSPFTIRFQGGISYVDWSASYLQSVWKLEKKNSEGKLVSTTTTDNVGVVNGFGAVWPKQVIVEGDGKILYNSNINYPYKAYVDMHLNFSSDAKNTHLVSHGFVDEANDLNSHTSEEFKERRDLFTEGKTPLFESKLFVDFFQTNKLFLNNTSLTFTIYPKEQAFLLLAPNHTVGGTVDDFKLTILKLRLYVKCCDPMDSLAFSLAQRLMNAPYKLAFRRNQIHTLNIGAGLSEVFWHLTNSQLPRRVIFFAVKRADYIGELRTSPFKTTHLDINDIRLRVLGQELPTVPYTDLNFFLGRGEVAYNDMMRALGFWGTRESNGITYKKFMKDSTFFVYNVTSTLENSDDCFELIREGPMDLQIKFANNTPTEGAILIAYMEFDAMFMIDANRHISTDLIL